MGPADRAASTSSANIAPLFSARNTPEENTGSKNQGHPRREPIHPWSNTCCGKNTHLSPDTRQPVHPETNVLRSMHCS